MKISGTNISMIRGDSEDIKVTCKDLLGEQVDFIEGDVVYFTVKSNTNTEVKIFQKTVTEFVAGLALISIEPDDTKALSIGNLVYDVQLNKTDGTVKTIIPPSRFSITAEVTYD